MSDETLVESDRPRNLFIVALIVVCVTLLLGIVIGVDQLFKFAITDEISSKQLQPENSALRALRAEEQDRLGKYRYVDREKGVVRLPIDRAVELTLRDWSARADGTVPAGGAGAAPAPAVPAAPEQKPATK